MQHKKLVRLKNFYGQPVDDLMIQWYKEEQLSSQIIADKVYQETGISVTAKGIQYILKLLGIARNKSEARKVGIRRGRIDYNPLRKPIKSVELRKGISLKRRYEIMKRDNFRCVLCGVNAKETKLIIDHIVPVTGGGTNGVDNLRTLCMACNHGKKIHEKER
jgi:hypothetical protein